MAYWRRLWVTTRRNMRYNPWWVILPITQEIVMRTFLKKRLFEPSTWAGIGVVVSAGGAVVASKGADTAAVAQVFAGLAAILAPEKG